MAERVFLSQEHRKQVLQEEADRRAHLKSKSASQSSNKVREATPEELTYFIRQAARGARARPTTRQRESRTAANQYAKRLRARAEYNAAERQQNLAFAQALGQERAANAALREQSVLEARQDFQKSAARAAIPGRIGGAALKSATGSPIAGTLGSVVGAIAIAIILYILLTKSAGVQGTSSSILNFVTALTSTDPLFIKSNGSTTSSSSSSTTQNPNTTTSGSNTGGK